MHIQDRLIVALDFQTHEDAQRILDTLGSRVTFYKVGLELFLNTGGAIIDTLSRIGKKIFLDLKFHDIPNTTAAASKFVAGIPGVEIFNVHATGGFQMVREASLAKRPGQILLAVTVLTSLDEQDLQTTFQNNNSILSFAKHLAKESHAAGADGVVCSAFEAASIKESCGANFLTVCPGIRINNNSNLADQKRVLNPYEAIKNGADYLVVGRPITCAPDPNIIVEEIFEGIDKGLNHGSI